MLAMHGRIAERAKPILELNPTHRLTLALAGRFKEGKDKALIEDAAWLILDEARLMEGAGVENPSAFGARLRRVMEKALG
jgi:molecular chaperone HtpG